MKELTISPVSGRFIRLVISVFFSLFLINANADNLITATATGSTTTTTTDVFVDVASVTIDVGSNASDAQKVMIVATYEVLAINKNAHKASFRIKDVTNGVYSETLVRHLERAFDGDKGIGSVVYIFDVSANSGTVNFSLQHATDNDSYNNTTSGTLAAIVLSTEVGHCHLSNDLKSITTEVFAGEDTFTTVTGLETNAISLATSGSVFLAVSINSRTSTGSTQTGQWKLQQRKGSSGTWTDLGQTISRTITNNSDEGIASLGMVSTGLASADYYYRLQHKGPVSTTIETLNTSLIAISLAYDDPSLGGRAFPAFNTDLASISTSSSSLTPALSQPGTPASNTDLFLYAQYNMSASDALDAPVFDIYVTDDDTYSYSSGDQSRTLSNSSDQGSGASVGMAQTLLLGTDYTASVRHQSDGAITLTTTNITLSGFQTTDQISEGYWTGVTSNVWNNTGNWADGIIPLSTTNVTISDKVNDPQISAGAVCKNLGINSGVLTVDSGGSLTVAEEIINEEGVGGLVIESGATGDGSLIFSSGSPSATVNRYVDSDDWHMVSPILDGLTANDFYIDETHSAWLITYSETLDSWTYITDLSTSLSQTTGYMYWVDVTANTVELTGSITASDQLPSLIKSGLGFNALGNPFTAALDWDEGTWGSNSTGTVYVWDPLSSDYLTWNGSTGGLTDGIIPLGQGFFVEASTEGEFTIPEAARVHDNQAFYKSTANEPSQYVRIQLGGNGIKNTVFVGFPENGTDEFDYRGDATKLYSSSLTPQLFAVEKDKELCINANAPLSQEAKTIPLHLVQIIDGDYTLSLSNLDQLLNTDIVLEDIKMGITQDLIQNPLYLFSAAQGDSPERFLLHFSPSTISGNEDLENDEESIVIYAVGNTIYIHSHSEAVSQSGHVYVYDLLGREILSQDILAGEIVKLNVSSHIGVVIVEVKKGDFRKVEKIQLE